MNKPIYFLTINGGLRGLRTIILILFVMTYVRQLNHLVHFSKVQLIRLGQKDIVKDVSKLYELCSEK